MALALDTLSLNQQVRAVHRHIYTIYARVALSRLHSCNHSDDGRSINAINHTVISKYCLSFCPIQGRMNMNEKFQIVLRVTKIIIHIGNIIDISYYVDVFCLSSIGLDTFYNHCIWFLDVYNSELGQPQGDTLRL
jgi:hypothetical protein